MMLNEDYKDILRVLSGEKVKFLIVGAYAMAAHGYLRGTLDIDIWVLPSAENADAVLRSLRLYGAPMFDLTKEDLIKEGTVFQIGVAPRRIDIITEASGLKFDEAYRRSLLVNLEGIEARVPALDDLIHNKRASGRPKDLSDVIVLEDLKYSG